MTTQEPDETIESERDDRFVEDDPLAIVTVKPRDGDGKSNTAKTSKDDDEAPTEED